MTTTGYIQTYRPPNFEDIFCQIKKIEKTEQSKKIYKILSDIFDSDKKNFYDFLVYTAQHRLFERIQIDDAKSIFARINVLLAYSSRQLNQNQSFQSTLPPYFLEEENAKDSLTKWVKDSKKPDLTKEDVDLLSDYNQKKLFFLNEFLKKFHLLSKSESLHSFSTFITKIHKEGNCPHTLLHYAVQAKKYYIVNYLLGIGANTNTANKNSSSAIMVAFDALLNAKPEEFNHLSSIFSVLLDHRRPVQEAEMFYLLDLCSPKDKSYNLGWLDEVFSLFFGSKQNISRFFNEHIGSFEKFIAHMYDIKGVHPPENAGGNIQAINLEGIHRDIYIQLHLRLFLEMMIDGVYQDILSTRDLSKIYREFLIGLECGWISQLLYKWRNMSRLSGQEKETGEFCNLLSQYVFKQILSLHSGSEYPLHVGWPGHSICVVFEKEGNLLSIRIDNLGQGLESNHNHNAASVQSRLSKKFEIDDGNRLKEGIKDVSSQVTEYLSSLFFNCAFAFPNEEKTIKELIQKVYNQELFPLPMSNDSPYYPCQTVGNCTFASFSAGMRKRLGDELFNRVIGNLSGILKSNRDKYLRDQSQFQHIPEKSLIKKLSENENYFSFKLKNHLRAVYEQFLPKEIFPYIMQENFSVPQYIMQENFSVAQIAKKDLVQCYAELIQKGLNKKETTYKMLIEANAGLGKTILSKAFAKTWQTDKKENVIYLLLRNLSNEQRYPLLNGERKYTLIDVIEKEFYEKPLNDLEKRLLTYELNCKETVWVLDGLDELHVLPQLEEVVNELMSKERLIATSRPVPLIPLKINFDQKLRLQSYAPEEIDHFINANFDDLDLRQEIKGAIATKKELNKLCSVPITLNVICQTVKQGNKEILNKKDISELYDSCITAHLKQAYERSVRATLDIPDYKIRDAYKTAVDFMKGLAYQSLIKYRNLFCSDEMIKYTLDLQNIKDFCIKQCLFDELKNIGLLEITPSWNQAEFVHATFQEYFAACFLIKSLKKSKKTPEFANAEAFIKTHVSEYEYQNVFSFVVHQLLFLISQKQDEYTKQKFIELLNRYVSYFTQPLNQERPYYLNKNISLQGISLLNAYSKGVGMGILTEEKFINEYKSFIETSFQVMLSDFKSSSYYINGNSDSLIPSRNISTDGDSQFVTLFLAFPSLKEQCQVYLRLLSNLEEDNSQIFTLTWRTVFFIQSLNDFNSSTIYDVTKVALKIKDRSQKEELLKGILELTIDEIKKILLPQSLSEDNKTALKQINRILDKGLLPYLYQIEKQQIMVFGKILDCLNLLLKEKDRYINQEDFLNTSSVIKKHLPNYVKLLFSSCEREKVVEHCQKLLIYMKAAGIPLSFVFNENTIQPLQENINQNLKYAKGFDGRQGRGMYISIIGFAMKHYFPIIDWVNPSHGDVILQELQKLHSSGGCVVSHQARNGCRAEVEDAIANYEPCIDASHQEINESSWGNYLRRLKNDFDCAYRLMSSPDSYKKWSPQKIQKILEMLESMKKHENANHFLYNFRQSLLTELQRDRRCEVWLRDPTPQ